MKLSPILLVTGEEVRLALHMPANNCTSDPTTGDIIDMLESIGYNGDMTNLGKIGRKCMRKEWNFFCDAFIKSFSGKISNFDALTINMQHLMYMLLFYRYHDIGSLILFEIVAKLGPTKNSPKNIYYARFIMLLINHLVPDLQINQPNNKWNCWVQSKRVIKDIFRANLNNEVVMVHPPLIQVFLSTRRARLSNSSSNPPPHFFY